MRDARFERVDLTGSRFHLVELNDVWIRQADLHRVRMRGVELLDVEIDGELQNVVVNGVDVGPLIEAEMARQDPDYAKMKPTTADGFREAWDILERRWAETVERARPARPGAPARAGRRRVVVHRDPAPPLLRHRRLGQPGLPRRPRPLVAARPALRHRSATWSGTTTRTSARSLDEVLTLARRPAGDGTPRPRRPDRHRPRRARPTPVEGEGWPPPDSYSVAEALSIVVNEEWHHRRFAERDLGVLEARA